MDAFERYDTSPAAAWVVAFVAGVAAVVAGALLFPVRFGRGFLWRYFWGPVHADALGANCVVHLPGTAETLVDPPEGCTAGAYDAAFVAEPGYTVVSTAGYIVVLVFMLAGVYLLLRRFDISPPRYLFYALVPFMLFGGALRTVEDAFVAALRAGEVPAVEYPLSAVLISPFIYFTVFAVTLAALLLAKWLAHADITETYYYPLGAMGGGVLAVAFGYVTYLAFTTSYVGFNPGVLVAVLGVATVLAAVTYRAADRYSPDINRGTGLIGLVVIWGHAVDGAANVLATDWTWVWGLGQYSPKHPFNQFIIETTAAIQPASVTTAIGSAWPFLIVKLIVPVLIIAIFDEEFVHENPYYAVMLLVAVVAVGLGPGTRDMIRVTFGI